MLKLLGLIAFVDRNTYIALKRAARFQRLGTRGWRKIFSYNIHENFLIDDFYRKETFRKSKAQKYFILCDQQSSSRLC
ncbi:hypothetical protein CBF18_06945 [Mastigocladus laminosus WC112]|nr:hypothetical protein CBF18_06945 [Mastigocladus laminosus WC112]